MHTAKEVRNAAAVIAHFPQHEMLLAYADLLETHGATQAKLDRLMLEHCPDEMTPEQIAEWERHQAVAPETEALAAAREEHDAHR